MLDNHNNAIAVLDSGMGGISILKKLIKRGGEYIYYADNDYMPYGNKDPIQLKQRLESIVDMLLTKYRVKSVIIACNTASTLLDNRDNIVTMQFQHNLTYLATKLTKSKLPNVNIIADSTLASLIERNICDRKAIDRIVREHVKKYKLNKLDAFVLGCTHYELVSDLFIKYCPNTQVFCNSDFIIPDIEYSSDDYIIHYITSRQSLSYERMLAQLAGEV